MNISDMLKTTFVGGEFEMSCGQVLTVTPDRPLSSGTVTVRIKLDDLFLTEDVLELVSSLNMVAAAMERVTPPTSIVLVPDEEEV